jgi:hypothetical protein
MPRIAERLGFDCPVVRVYGAFADLAGWPAVLPDTLDVEVLYSDGYNEEFTMTVERPGGPETVRGVRYCRPPHELELFQTTPPPGFARMRGRWEFAPDPATGGSVVVATRDFELAPGAASDERAVAGMLSQVLRRNLELFREAVELDGPH